MQERLCRNENMSPIKIRGCFFSDSGCLNGFRAEYKKSFGKLTPGLAIKIADMMSLREEPNSSEKVKQIIDGCLTMVGVDEKLAQGFMEVRNRVLSDAAVGANTDQASSIAMEQFFHRENLY